MKRRAGPRAMALTIATILIVADGVACVAGQQPRGGLETAPRVHTVRTGPNAQFELIARLIEAVPGDVIELQPGTYHFDSELNVVASHVTIRGAGPDKTILSFQGQQFGSDGIVATGDALVIEDLAVQDTVWNAIKVNGADGVTFRRVRAEWTGGTKSTNGPYGIYPVQCRNVLIEDCVAIGASDAGIYVGQSRDVVVRGCRAERNVAGIEIENTIRADVYDNTATDNAGGILVFDLPGLDLTNGGDIRVFRNRVVRNNTPNFAAEGTMVANIPTGTGVMIMAADRVELFDNEIIDNQTTNVSVVSFLITERRISDEKYDPFAEGVYIHDNRIAGGGSKPTGRIGQLLAPVIGVPFPDIFYDGAVDERKFEDGKLPDRLRLKLGDNGDARFANVNIASLTPENVLGGKYRAERDRAPYTGRGDRLAPVTLEPHPAPRAASSPAVAVYRSVPKRLADWRLFEANGATQQPVAGVVPYDLNTALFSDYSVKHRFIRIPDGTRIRYDDHDVFEFPVGTVIVKTFAYPQRDRMPPSREGGPSRELKPAGNANKERLLETRIQLHEPTGWFGFSYLWNEEQTDARLALGGATLNVEWPHDDEQIRSNRYQVPNANQCLSCHGQDNRFVPLGPTARNLNREFNYAHGRENQLAYWTRTGLLEGAPASDRAPRLAEFDNPTSAPVADRARAWLDVNCAHCHSPAGSARAAGLDLRLSQSEPSKYGVWKSPVASGRGTGDRRYSIVPGKPDESILLFRIEAQEPGIRMPNLSRNLVPLEAAAVVREWIEHLPTTD